MTAPAIKASSLSQILTDRFRAAGGEEMSTPVDVKPRYIAETPANWETDVSVNAREVTIWDRILDEAATEFPTVEFD